MMFYIDSYLIMECLGCQAKSAPAQETALSKKGRFSRFKAMIALYKARDYPIYYALGRMETKKEG